ncbi:MAG: formate/nitrite transporter family protein, partial [Candidatus Eremiobacteraeota bacterium]|nr:formate/nitrite transporter family protein [Candidatus Eremiobacteraeota bacterium]
MTSTANLSRKERDESIRRAGLRAAVVFETIRREGEQELGRPAASLAFSGLAAGLSMGFSLVASGVIRAALPPAPWRPLLESIGYTAGFLIVVLARQQLFTENTVTAIVPVLDDRGHGRNLVRALRLWAIVLATNLLGAVIFAYAAVHANAFAPQVAKAFLEIGKEASAPSFGVVFAKGIFAGWLIALMVWLLPAAENSRVAIVVGITYLVGAAALSHSIAGSVEVLYCVLSGMATWQHYAAGFLLPAFLGNSLGGVLLVSLLNYGQVAPEAEDEPQEERTTKGSVSAAR